MTFVKNPFEFLSEQVMVGNVTDVTFTGLNINNDRIYRLYMSVANPAAASDYQIFFNGDTTATNYYSNIISAVGGVTNFARFNEPRIVSGVLANVPGGAFYGYTDILFNSTFGICKWVSMNITNLTTNMGFINYAGTTVIPIVALGGITTITVHSTTASAIAIGSKFSLYRVSPI